MSAALLRLGLWIILITLAMYVIRDAFSESSAYEMIQPWFLRDAAIAGAGIIAAGIVASILENMRDKATSQSSCLVCRRPVPRGEFYCRQHLKKILEEEHDRTHGSRLHKT
jgi:hypothetical protein